MVEWKKLGEIGKFENIGTDKKIVEGEQLVTLLNYVDVYHHKHIDSTVPQMLVSAPEKKIADCTVKRGDIFVTPSSETVDDIGHSSVIEETISNAVYSYHIMRYRLFESDMLLSYYINYAFDTEIVKKQILKKAQGLTRFGLSKDKFASILIPIPSLSEQARIVGILDTFTSAIDNLKEQIAQRRKQYEYYRDQLLDLEGKEGVEMKTLEEVVSNNCSLSYGIVQPGDDVQHGVHVVRPVDLITMYVGQEGLKKTTKEISDSYKRTILRGNEILFCVRGTTGVMSLASETLKDCNVTRGIVPITIDDKITKMFVYYQLKGVRLQKIIADKTNGTALRQINVKDLRLLSLMLPSLHEQQRIVSILDTFEASIQNLEAQLKQRESNMSIIGINC
ncbi:MAG: restriction endonuclease subunit S [Bacteroidaceae bacterium]|nr:restriction endonuclease subunit S [Bacteroidaceae bacterium]